MAETGNTLAPAEQRPHCRAASVGTEAAASIVSAPSDAPPCKEPPTAPSPVATTAYGSARWALKDRYNYELYDDEALGPFHEDWHERRGRVVLTGEYGGMAGFRHVMDGLGIEIAGADEDLVSRLVQLCASATGKPLTDDELRLMAAYPHQLALLYPGMLG